MNLSSWKKKYRVSVPPKGHRGKITYTVILLGDLSSQAKRDLMKVSDYRITNKNEHAVWLWPLSKNPYRRKRRRSRNPRRGKSGRRQLDVFQRHQLRIALDTLKMNDVGASIMGGPTKEEAREIIYRLTGRRAKENPRRRSRKSYRRRSR